MGAAKRRRAARALASRRNTLEAWQKADEGIPPKVPRSGAGLWIYFALFVATIAAYAQVWQFDFVNFDDPEYVTQNPHVRAGLTIAGAAWAFTSHEAANWFPVTWLSHMLDCQLFGLQSGWHHLTNVFLHALATLLLFAFLERATHARWCSALVAFLFALHPLHVESVAWVAERKDVLSAFFWFLTLWLYVRYTERPSLGRYAPVLASFCLGLMAKPMLVTLPFVLLLLDVWPLRRIQITGRRALWEKAPFFVVSAIVAVITYAVQRASGAVQPLAVFPLGLRAENALISYIAYIAKTFWPGNLAVFYPHALHLPTWQVAGAVLAIVGISAFALGSLRAYPYLAVGWLWYLGTLVPVIGLVQVGVQARADRYSYIPLVGLFVMLVWGANELVQRRPAIGMATLVLASAGCAACFALTSLQVQHWRNSESLFRHALAVTSDNYVAEHNLGVALSASQEGLPEAIHHLEAAVRIAPHSAKARTDLGNALANTPRRLDDAIAQYRAALRIAPDSAITHSDLGNALLKQPGHVLEAIAEYKAALRLKPEFAEAHNNLGSALAEVPGRSSEAIAEFEAALRLDPEYSLARSNRDRAIAQDKAALQAKPDAAEAHNNLGVALTQTPGRMPDAIAHFEAALRIRPDYADAQYNLGIALSNVPGRMPEALRHVEAALRLKPDPEIQQTLDRLRAAQRR